MRRTLIAGAVAIVVLGAVSVVGARSLGLGPGARAAPESRVYVAVSRSEDETAAREIEVIDTASGERTLIDPGVRITTLAMATDRRTLYIGAADGRLLLVDPVTGAYFGQISTERPTHLVPLPGGSEVLSIAASAGAARVARLDTATRREVAAAALPGQVGRPALRGHELLVPFVNGPENGLVRLALPSLERLGVTTMLHTQARVYGVPLAHVGTDGALAYLAQWDAARTGAPLLVGEGPREVVLGVIRPGTDRPQRGLLEMQSSVASTPAGAIHACVGNAELAARYVVTAAAERVGAECGQFASAADRLYLAVRGKPRLAVIDPATGRVVRDLPLPGIPVALVT